MSVPALNPMHLAFFKDRLIPGPIFDPKSRKIPRKWAERTGLGAHLPDMPINRDDLFKLIENQEILTSAVCWSILAWGGMHGKHRDSLMEQKDDRWLRLANTIRSGHLSRQESYDAFSKLKAEGYLKGMGPAYFTKLIFFMMPRSASTYPPGYIMDQWVGSSVNLLADREVVLMNRFSTWKKNKTAIVLSTDLVVSELNDGTRYEEYCSFIEAIGRIINRPAAETELLLMSSGGKKKQSWRDYVSSQRIAGGQR
jgi:hypothetical protein